MYRYVIDALELDPTRCLFIAAHRWDCDAAAEQGFRTAYLDRRGDGLPTGDDFTAPDLAALATQLA
jgi:2-haloacid dehalogenase